MTLRTVPTFATTHRFCASRDGLRKSGFLTEVPAKTKIFFAVHNYAGKADTGKGYWNPKGKVRVTMHFSEITKLQFGKIFHTLFFILALFRIIVA